MLNIGICDDRPIFREYMMILIHEYEAENEVRFNLYQFDNGEALIEEFNKDKDYFDLFFLDNHLCGITGLETALYIRRNNRECQIVFATASDKLDTFMVVSPLQILSKPVQQEDINAILENVIAWKLAKVPGGSKSYPC